MPRSARSCTTLIVQIAVAWAVARAEPSEIDLLNIHRASLRCMRAAVEQLQPSPSFVLTDAFAIPGLTLPQRGLIRGDARVAAIAAASIVAKVVRDRVMLQLDAEDPRYGFAAHKGYATARTPRSGRPLRLLGRPSSNVPAADAV